MRVFLLALLASLPPLPGLPGPPVEVDLPPPAIAPRPPVVDVPALAAPPLVPPRAIPPHAAAPQLPPVASAPVPLAPADPAPLPGPASPPPDRDPAWRPAETLPWIIGFLPDPASVDWEPLPPEVCGHWTPGPAAARPGASAVGCNARIHFVEYLIGDLEAFARAMARDPAVEYCFVDIPVIHPAIYPGDPSWAALDAYYYAVQAELHREAARYGLACG